MQTYGDRPIPFQLGDQNGEYYHFASKVGKYLGMFDGSLFKSYPCLWRRLITVEERAKLVSLGLIPPSLTKNLTILKASEVNEIFVGRDGKYKIRYVTFEEFAENSSSDERYVTPEEMDSILDDQVFGIDYNSSSNRRYVTPEEFADILQDRELELYDRMNGRLSEY